MYGQKYGEKEHILGHNPETYWDIIGILGASPWDNASFWV